MPSADQKYLHLLRVFAFTGAAHAITQAALNAYFADWALVGIGLGALGFCAAYLRALPRIPWRLTEPLAHLFNALNLVLVAVLYPAGAASGIFFVAYAVSTVLLSSRRRYTAGLLALGAAVYLYVPGPHDYATPAYASFALSAVVSLAQFYYLLRDDLSGLRETTYALAAAEVRLAREAETVAARRADIRRLHGELAGARARLERQLAAETAVTERLRVRRGEERALVEAMHHDMREPLRSIVSFNQLIARRLRRRGISERGGQYLEFVADAGQRLASMLDDLLAYSTQASGERARVPCPLDDTIAAVRANLSAQLARTGATLEVGAGLPVVHGYPTPLLQLFQNLIANALKFSRPGVPPVVRVDVRWDDDGAAAVAVADNGIGIAPEHLASVFALFGRGGADESREGSGVGLALCERIARQHDGRLDVTSVPGEGSVFSVRLPAAVLRGAGDAPEASASPDPTTAPVLTRESQAA